MRSKRNDFPSRADAKHSCHCPGLDARSLKLAEPLASVDLGTEMFQTGSLSNLSSLQARLNNPTPLPASGGHSAYSYSSNNTDYSLSVDNNGQSYQVTPFKLWYLRARISSHPPQDRLSRDPVPIHMCGNTVHMHAHGVASESSVEASSTA